MEFFEVINNRRSIRQYKPDAVQKEDILKILDAANRAPSALNLQPWEFLVVAGEMKNKLGSNYGKIVDDYTKDWDEEPEKAFMPRNEFIQLHKFSFLNPQKHLFALSGKKVSVSLVGENPDLDGGGIRDPINPIQTGVGFGL